MRLSYVLLAAAATHLSSCDVTLAASMATADLTDAVANNGVGTRLLRSGNTDDDDLGDLNYVDSIDDSDDEERRIDFSTDKLKRMLDNETFMLKKFAEWDSAGQAASDVKRYLDLTDPNMVKLWNMYRNYLGA
ncbi:hypothetical protein PF008_g9974 [Phytophthora fragariae]|uniref:RxLR effector protein n=1 Tax=Phytophthora fragariae TaxID=53985 RepID=A0A6G0RV37_9STRA|nr:hypothetical protein PF008_g9974 [Phytophthora fragariae]